MLSAMEVDSRISLPMEIVIYNGTRVREGRSGEAGGKGITEDARGGPRGDRGGRWKWRGKGA